MGTVLQQGRLYRRGSGAGRRTPVVLVACAGRSGSTLLDRIIGAHEGFCSTGELRFIWERSFTDNQFCGCGLPFQECQFWDEVSREAYGVAGGELDVSSVVDLRRALDEMRQAPWLIQSRAPAAHRAGVMLYGRVLEYLYDAILQVSGERVVVDSSGDATHGLILARLPGVELHVVHLVRDPRAVAFSWKRSRVRPEIHWTSEVLPIENATTSARRWMLQNGMAELLARTALSYRRVHYEDFVLRPDLALGQILEPHAWAQAPADGLARGEITLEPSHTVSGNPSRFKHGPLRIKLDDEWRRSMDARDRRTVTAITWPLMARYGYSLRA